VRAEDPSSLETSFRDIADHLKLRGRQRQQVNIYKLLGEWLRNAENGEWLLVVDGLNRPSTCDFQATQEIDAHKLLVQYLPHVEHGHLLITSRTESAALDFVNHDDVIVVREMWDDEGAELLRNKLGRKVDTEEADRLTKHLEGFPLALVQIAAYIRRKPRAFSVWDCLDEIENDDERLTAILGMEINDPRRAPGSKNSILLTWQGTFQRLRIEHSSAADLLALISCFAMNWISTSFLQASGLNNHKSTSPENSAFPGLASMNTAIREIETSGSNFDEDIRVLTEYDLMIWSKDGEAVRMHHLQRLSIQLWLQKEGRLEHWKHVAAECVEIATLRAKDCIQREEWSKARQLLRGIVFFQKNRLETDDEHLLHTRASLAYVAYKEEEYEGCLHLLRKLMNSYEQTKAIISTEVQLYLCVVLTPPDSLLDYDQKLASIEARRLLQYQTQALGGNDPRTLDAMFCYAINCENEEQMLEADRCLRLRKSVLGPDDPKTLDTLHLAAEAWSNSSEHIELACSLFEECLSRRSRILGRNDKTTLLTMYDFAAFLAQESRLDAARSLCEEGYKLRKQVSGKSDWMTLDFMDLHANTLCKLGSTQAALPLYVECLAIRRHEFGRDDEATLRTLYNYASALYKSGAIDKALALFEECLELQTQVLGREDEETLQTMFEYVKALHDQNHLAKSLSLLKECVSLQKRVLGPDHQDTISSTEMLQRRLAVQRPVAQPRGSSGKLSSSGLLPSFMSRKRR
jgi:tetratricopeptide (TPR) repeat protein